jgi:hypothetical protein
VHLDFQAGGNYNLQRTPEVTSKGITYTRDVNGHSASLLLNLLVPLNNYWSVSADGGASSALSSTSETPVTSGSNTDNPSINGLLSARYYFVHRSLRAAEPDQNPDRWPSAAFTVSGADTVYDDVTETSGANTFFRTDNFSQSMTLTGDSRLPISDAVTLLTSVAGTFADSETAEFINSNGADQQGTQTRSKSITAGEGMRYYFVGRNLIKEDAHQNPDRWTSVSLMATGSTTLDARQKLTLKGSEDDRNIDTKSANGTFELRLPVANGTTIRIGLTGGVSRTQTPATSLNAGATTFQPSVGGYLGLRGYFF